VYLTDAGLACYWDRPPSPAWPKADVDYYDTVTILRAVATATGQSVLGVQRARGGSKGW